MVFGVTATLFSGFTQGAAITAATTTLTANVINDFFTSLFLHPEKNTIAVLAISGISVAACIGLVFLVKLVYEKYIDPKSQT